MFARSAVREEKNKRGAEPRWVLAQCWPVYWRIRVVRKQCLYSTLLISAISFDWPCSHRVYEVGLVHRALPPTYPYPTLPQGPAEAANLSCQQVSLTSSNPTHSSFLRHQFIEYLLLERRANGGYQWGDRRDVRSFWMPASSGSSSAAEGFTPLAPM